MAYETHKEWINLSSGKHEIEHILSLDFSDRFRKSYEHNFNDSALLVNDNKNCVEATNIAAKESTGDILVYLSDDFHTFKNWDLELSRLHREGEYLIVANDGITDGKEIATIPIMSRPLYLSLGYFWNPLYQSMYCDEDLYQVCKRRGCIIKTNLKFEHHHWTNGKVKKDEVYERHDNKKRSEEGFVTFVRRRRTNFQTEGIYK